MTQKEKLMYQIMGKVSESDAPIVFKGAMVTKLILAESGYTDLERQTKDIDANWIGIPPTMEDLVDTINKALEGFNGDLYAQAIRVYDDKKSAGIAIVETATGNRIITLDISIKPVHGSRVYYHGEIGVRGVLANEILADKLTVMSKRLIFRRTKDIIDVYAITHCVHVVTSDIYEIFKKHPTREVGTFDEFFNRISDLEHAYNKLAGVEGKPAFDDVYSYLSIFVQPFAQRDETPRVWFRDGLKWEDKLQKETERSFIEIPENHLSSL